MERIRSIETLTNDEIIGLVDILLVCSTLRTEGVPLMESGDMSYRKIEAQQAKYHDGIIIRVTTLENLDGEKEVVAFIVEDGGDDVFILPVNRTKFVKEYVDEIGITYDFSIIDQPLRKVYMYFAETLQMWNLSDIKVEVNKEISDVWYTVDERMADF